MHLPLVVPFCRKDLYFSAPVPHGDCTKAVGGEGAVLEQLPEHIVVPLDAANRDNERVLRGKRPQVAKPFNLSVQPTMLHISY